MSPRWAGSFQNNHFTRQAEKGERKQRRANEEQITSSGKRLLAASERGGGGKDEFLITLCVEDATAARLHRTCLFSCTKITEAASRP